jgi:DNA-binding transcriptional regulator LsrR (DeoR family)
MNMAQERLTVRKIKEILRLKYEVNLSNRAIAGACKVSKSTVGEYLQRARDDPERHRPIPMPNWEMVHLEKRRKGITLKLLCIFR